MHVSYNVWNTLWLTQVCTIFCFRHNDIPKDTIRKPYNDRDDGEHPFRWCNERIYIRDWLD